MKRLVNWMLTAIENILYGCTYLLIASYFLLACWLLVEIARLIAEAAT